MKETNDDIEFRALLKKSTLEAGENEWFTKKVMNRLPEKANDYSWVEKLLYVVGSLLCIICWIIYFETTHFNVITVRDLVVLGFMGVVTLVVMGQTIRRMLSLD